VASERHIVNTNRAETAALPAEDARWLRRFECLLVVLVVLLVAAHGRDDAWPFIVWPMYARGYPPPPDQVRETELRLVSRDGAVMHLLPADVFTHVEIDLGRRIVAQAFVEQPSAEPYRRVILRRLRPLLEGRDVVEIEAWTLAWTPHPTAVPPFDLARPEQEMLLGRMRVSNDGPRTPGALTVEGR
jgi:hypothetical protein